MINVLFVESGGSGGGSFESLYQHMHVVARDRIRPVVVYLNDNRFVSRVRDLDIPVYVLKDRLYSAHAPRLKRWLAIKLREAAMRLERYLPGAYLQAVWWLHRPFVTPRPKSSRNEQIDIVHLNDDVARDLFGLFAAEKTGIPCVSHMRSLVKETRSRKSHGDR